MDLEKQNTWSGQRKFIFIILLCFAFSVTGCEPSHEEREAEREAEREELRHKEKVKIKILLEKHNAIYFPPEGLGADAFTYELQRFFSADAEKAVLFKGYLEDIEKTERGIVVEFLCPLGEEFYIDKIAICFRLIASEEKTKQLLSFKQEDLLSFKQEDLWLLYRYFDEPNYFVVAKINELKRSRRYEFRGDEEEIDIETPPSFVSTGKLVEAIHISND